MFTGFSIINQPFWGFPIYGNPHILEFSFKKPAKICSLTSNCNQGAGGQFSHGLLACKCGISWWLMMGSANKLYGNL